MKGDKVVVRMQSGICAASFVGVLKMYDVGGKLFKSKRG